MTTANPETLSVAVERQLAAPPEKVWRALTQPHLIADWLMANDFAPNPGHKFKLRGDWGGVLDCEVLEVEPPRVLAYSWNYVHEDAAFDLRSTVTFTLTAAGAGTHLRVEQAGFRPGQKQAYAGAKFGWEKNLAKLDELLGRDV